jgi:hypothetical protein
MSIMTAPLTTEIDRSHLCRGLKIANPDNDKTISKDEYLAFVEVAFKRANPDNDATIDAKLGLGRPRAAALADEVTGGGPLRLFRMRQAPRHVRALMPGLKRKANARIAWGNERGVCMQGVDLRRSACFLAPAS